MHSDLQAMDVPEVFKMIFHLIIRMHKGK